MVAPLGLFNKMVGEKATWELHKDAIRCFDERKSKESMLSASLDDYEDDDR